MFTSTKSLSLLSQIACIVLLGLISSQTMAAKGFYKWTDAEGNPQHSDRPPTGVEYIFIETSAAGQIPEEPTSSPATATAGDADQTTNDDKISADEAAPEGKMEVMPAKDPKVCAQAQANLASLSGKQRIRMTDPDGSQRMLTADEIAIQKERAEKYVEMHCE